MKKWIFVILLFVILFWMYFLAVYDILSIDMFQDKKEMFQSYVDGHPLLSPLVYIVIYTAFVTLLFPAGSLLTIAGGFLFPQPFSTLYTITGATAGAVVIFSIMKPAFRHGFSEKTKKYLKKFEKGFHQNGWVYLLISRVALVFPFWFVNLAAAVVKAPLWTFTWTTAIGIIPGTFMYTQAGRGLDVILERGQQITFWTVLNREIIIAVVSLITLLVLICLIKWKMKGKI